MIFILILANTIYAQHSYEKDVCQISQVMPVHAVNPNVYGTLMARKNGCNLREYDTYASLYDLDDCMSIPRTLTTRLKSLSVTTSAIEEIHVGDFENFQHIEHLEIGSNTKLIRIEPGVFRNMIHLKNLSMSFNTNLVTLEKGLFEGLINLEVLRLDGNGFNKIKSFSLALSSNDLPKLSMLSLEGMSFAEILEDDFDALRGTRLKQFEFINSQINEIHPQAFTSLQLLETLDLSENLLDVENLEALITQMIQSGIPLRTLRLSGAGFRKDVPRSLLEIIGDSNITELSLSKNQFDVINDDAFPSMPRLKYLDLSSSIIASLTSNALSGAPKLETLMLNDNKFSFVPDGCLLESLKVLDLSKGPIYFTLERYKFLKSPNLCKLNISYNNLRRISHRLFIGLTHLMELNMKYCHIVNIEDFTFANLTKLVELNLEGNGFPTRTFKKEIFYGLNNLEVLILINCSISAISPDLGVFNYLKSLKYLDLAKNSLKTLEPPTFNLLRSLNILHLGNNDLTVWHKRLFVHNKNLKTLFVEGNNLAYITEAMFEDCYDLIQIDFSDNPFDCECRNSVPLKQFGTHKNVSKVIELLKNRTSSCVDPVEYTNLTLVDYYEIVYRRELCDWYLKENYLIYVIPGITLGILSCFALIIYLYRWHIRYWIFLTKLALYRNSQFMKRSTARSYTNYEYDAFVSYSSDDRNFVVRLVAMLENYEPFLRLCVYERDFEIGTIISENVLESVAKSRKTLLVISESYIKSQWCRWEVQVAEHHRLFFENEYGECVNDSIIMIKLGDIALANLSPMLKYLMKTRIYLQWDANESKQQAFWQKLRNALSQPVSESKKC